ncbi:MAG: DUF3137 domain-containing protein [Firmicutes bacterium]|nr:DUF3137 domain-containing protein [Bacillota bacterium]
MDIEELEKLRIKAKKIVLIGGFCSIIFGIFLFYITKLFPTLFIGVVVGIIITLIISSKPSKMFTMAFKEKFVLKSLKNIFTDLKYQPEIGIDESTIRDTQMMDMGDRYSSNDYISAKYKNIAVIQSDVHIEEKHETRDSDGNKRTTWVTIFRGRWMIFDFNKNFKANIQVSQKGFGNSRINNWGNKLKYKKIMMEDQVFNNQFRIYAQNEHDAFYVLTPSLMEKIKSLTNTINGKILLCFIDNKLHVGIQNNKDSFEHSIFKKINEDKVIEEISKDIKLITNFVDELDLDNDLFRKEV